MKTFKKNNKGFSLVELIVVIAIMAVLGVAIALAVTKFIPQSQRSTDISNATMIAEACEVAVNDFATSSTGEINSVKENEVFGTAASDGTCTVTLSKLVATGLLKSDASVGGSATGLTLNTADATGKVPFSVTYNKKTGQTKCIIGTFNGKNVDLCVGDTATCYKNDELAKAKDLK